MSSTGTATPTHPLLGFARALDAALDKVIAGPDPAFMPAAEKKQALIEISRQAERLEALRHRLLGTAGEAACQEAAPSVAALVARHTHRDARAVTPEARLAEALEKRWTRTQTAWAAGDVNRDQARVIVEALEKLPSSVTADQRVTAEEHLLVMAADYGPHALRNLGAHLLEVIAPDEADRLLGEALEAEEANARRATRLTLKRCGDGSTRLTGRIPDHVAARLRGLLEAYTSPRRRSTGSLLGDGRDPATGDRLHPERLRGQAFCALLEHADPDTLPAHGGTATTLMISMELKDLLSGLGSGTLPDGSPLSPGQVRRLACTADLVPAVLGGDSEVLDLGRRTRLFTSAQIRALRLRDQHCRAEGCTIPATWCEAHHEDPWAAGGRTDLANGVLLCPYHHHRVDDPSYRKTRLPNGDYRFHRRT